MSKPKPIQEIPEWAHTSEKLESSPEACAKIAEILANPPAPSERLRAAAAPYWRRCTGR